MDYFDKQTWAPVKLDILFEDIAYILKPNEIADVHYQLFPECNRTGKYRIKKHITLTGNSTKAEGYTICAEFEIEKRDAYRYVVFVSKYFKCTNNNRLNTIWMCGLLLAYFLYA